MSIISKKTVRVNQKALELGPLESVFPCSESKILDFFVTFRDYDYSISDVAKNSGVGFKTTLSIIHKFEEQKIIKRERTVGKAIMYKLNMASPQSKSISKLAIAIAVRRIQ